MWNLHIEHDYSPLGLLPFFSYQWKRERERETHTHTHTPSNQCNEGQGSCIILTQGLTFE
jgi:hypothetical protein